MQVYDRSKLYYLCRFMNDNMALMVATVQDVLKNGIPRSTSPHALASRKAANDLLEWMREDSNAERLELFSFSVVQLLDKAIQPDSAHTQAGREKMWGLFHSIRTSYEYKCHWTTFLEESMVNATTLLFQTITDKLFQKRIDYHLPLQDVSPSLSEAEGDAFTFEEENAIRYAAGYVFCALRKKIIKSAYPQKEQLSDIVEVLLQNDDQDDSAEHDTSCEWMEIVDRGGLIHISDKLFRVFIAIELEIRRHFRVENAQKITASYEGKVAARILTNVFYFTGAWCAVMFPKSCQMSF